MSMNLRKIIRDQEGGAAIEMAIALPLLVSFIYGIFQIGLVFQANAGVKHALGEAAREATIWPIPTDDELKAIVKSKSFGTHNGTLKDASIVINKDENGDPDGSRTITLTYAQPTDFIFFAGPTVDIVQSKRVYTAL